MAHYSAKNARVTINGTAFKCKKWTADIKVETHDVTSFESAGYGEYVVGIADADISMELDLDIGATTTNIAQATVGATLTNVKLFMPSSAAAPSAAAGNTFLLFASVIVTDNGFIGGVRETISATIKGKSTGSFTTPF